MGANLGMLRADEKLVQDSVDLTDEQKKKYIDTMWGTYANGSTRAASDGNIIRGDYLSYRQKLYQDLGDAKRKGDATREKVKQASELQSGQVNSKLQQVRVNSFLGSVGVQKAAGGMK